MLNKLLGGGLVDSVGKIVDELHTSEEEKAQWYLSRLIERYSN